MKIGPFDQTWFCNQLGYDIAQIRPYAAYDVLADEWIIKPPHLPHWSFSELPTSVQQVLRAADSYARHVLKLPEPERTQQGAALFDAWHSDRSRAFSDRGEGWYDIANLREKWGDQSGWWAELVACKHRADEGLDAAPADWSNVPSFYHLCDEGTSSRRTAVETEGLQPHQAAVYRAQSAMTDSGADLYHYMDHNQVQGMGRTVLTEQGHPHGDKLLLSHSNPGKSYVKYEGEGNWPRIGLAPNHLHSHAVFHELAHILTNGDHESGSDEEAHGPAFVHTYRHLLDSYDSSKARQVFDEHYRPPEGSRHEAKLPKTQKCEYCGNQATKRLLWAEGMAYIPVCDSHEPAGRHRIEVTNQDEVSAVHKIASTGETVHYVRNNSGMRQTPGFGQEHEPWGRYMSPHSGHVPDGWESGTVHFDNPLHVDHADGEWKRRLSEAHDGATGKELSSRLLAAGHDAVMTHDKYGVNEIVDIRPRDQRTHQITAASSAIYHWAPREHRDDIAEHGLDHRRSPDFQAAAPGVHGNFFHKDEATARDWVPGIEKTHDLYRVRARGLQLHPDPYDTADAFYTAHPVSPDRLTRIASAQIWITPQLVMGSAAGLNHARVVGSTPETLTAIREGLTAVLPADAWFVVRATLIHLGMSFLDVNQRLKQLGAPISVTG
jgi:hypothetical protein